MSGFGDDHDDMLFLQTLDDRAVEALLAGRTPHGREDLAALATLLVEARSVGDGAPPQPSLVLAAVLAEGVPADLRIASRTAQRSAARPRRSAWATVRTYGRSVALKLAGLGVAAKALLVLTATAAVAVGTAATDLPETVSEVLRISGNQAPVTDASEAGSAPRPASGEPRARQDAGAGPPAATPQPTLDGPQGATEDGRDDGVSDSGLPRAREEISDTPAQVPSEAGPEAGNGQGPPAGVPQGPPAGVPHGPPAGVTQGPPAGVTQGPPAGVPQGPPAGVPQGPPSGDPSGRPSEGR